jgi:beta-phosphoglucomutase-like phosphatase (HAD superfamily)
VALEDSAVGISAARLAGLTVIAIPESEIVDASAADRVAASLAELLPDGPSRAS